MTPSLCYPCLPLTGCWQEPAASALRYRPPSKTASVDRPLVQRPAADASPRRLRLVAVTSCKNKAAGLICSSEVQARRPSCSSLVTTEAKQRTRPPSTRERLELDARRSFR